MIDLTTLEEIIHQNLEFNIKRAFGENSLPDFTKLMGFISEFYKNHPPEKIIKGFSCIIGIEELTELKGTMVHRMEVMEQLKEDACFILLDASNIFICESGQILLNAPGVISYQFNNGTETIWANGEKIPIRNPDSASLSIFAQPTYKDLDEALHKYYEKNAKYSICSKLNSAWLDSEKIRFKSKPEHLLRDSLWLFLRIVLRGNPDVKREQNVDESNPVDIKVTWKSTKAIALIEIKWLGKSFDLRTKRMTRNFTQVRAIQGAEQLIRYINTSVQEEPHNHYIGFLVLFDARRRGIRDIDNKISLNDALYYREKEIEYPEHIKTHNALRLSYRFFLEPNIAG
mgnify:CR=1 FL=1|jgi:hypothetical protein